MPIHSLHPGRPGLLAGRWRTTLLATALTTLLSAAPGHARGEAGEVDLIGEWPLSPHPIQATFDPPDADWSSGHRGVDVLGHPGQPVRSALPGTVTYAARLAGRGVVVVSHGDTRTTYEPVTAAVEVGDAVAAGDRLGTLSVAGSHCWPRTCLHWGWRRGDDYLDPLRLVGGGPVRLLPLHGAPQGITPPAHQQRFTSPLDWWRSWVAAWPAASGARVGLGEGAP